MAASGRKPTILIVPGAWHVPWHYKLLVSSLEQRGYPVKCLSHPSIHREGPWTETSEDDVGNVAAAIKQEATLGNEVVVVMHSYGGVPGSIGTEGLLAKDFASKGEKGGVSKLVYMVAVAFPNGIGLAEEIKAKMNIAVNPDGSYMHGNPGPLLYSDIPEPLFSQAVSHLTPQSQGTLFIKGGFEPWKEVPSHYVLCENDPGMPLEAQHMFASLEGGRWSTSTVKSGHSPFLVCPDDVAGIIVEFAEREETTNPT